MKLNPRHLTHLVPSVGILLACGSTSLDDRDGNGRQGSGGSEIGGGTGGGVGTGGGSGGSETAGGTGGDVGSGGASTEGSGGEASSGGSSAGCPDPLPGNSTNVEQCDPQCGCADAFDCTANGDVFFCLSPAIISPPPQPVDDPAVDGFRRENCGALFAADSSGHFDCTAFGDTNASCVFGNHCYCTEGFVCAVPPEGGRRECEPSVTCIPAP